MAEQKLANLFADLTLGECIADRRNRAGLTQAHLGNELGYSRTMITMIEADETNFPAAFVPALCSSLKCSPNELFGWLGPVEVANG